MEESYQQLCSSVLDLPSDSFCTSSVCDNDPECIKSNTDKLIKCCKDNCIPTTELNCDQYCDSEYKTLTDKRANTHSRNPPKDKKRKTSDYKDLLCIIIILIIVCLLCVGFSIYILEK